MSFKATGPCVKHDSIVIAYNYACVTIYKLLHHRGFSMTPRTRTGKSAFTLVELSIVLVILGLLVGGVLGGQSLINAAKLRSVVTQYQRYLTATEAFRDKYRGLPGDLKNGATFWGAADGSTGSTAACVTTAATGTLTCNGNGDGIILPSTSSNESYQFWHQLANAGLIEGTYDGIQHGSNTYSSTTANSPQGRYGSSLWFVWNWGISAGSTGTIYALQYDNFFEFGGIVANGDPDTVILKPEELWNIDTKLDDGIPATGTVIARNYGTCTNSASITDTSGTYLLTSSAVGCIAIFRQIF